MKKRVLLICFYDRICLSIRSLASVLKASGHEVHLLFVKDDRAAVIDQFQTGNLYYQMRIGTHRIGIGEDIDPVTDTELGLIRELCTTIQPHVVGVSARSVAKSLSWRVIREIREILPEARYIGGGYGPSVEPAYFLQFLDFVCIGEAEHIINDLVAADDPATVANVACMKGGAVVVNPIGKAADLDALLYPDWSLEKKYLVEDDTVKVGEDMYHLGTYDIFASRGCPAACTYCGAAQWGRICRTYGGRFPKIRLRSPGNVIDELKAAMANYPLRQIRFKDSIFGFNKKWFHEFMDRYDREISLPFHCFLDERYTDEEMVRRLKASGLRRTTVGIQSVNEGVRRNIFNRQISNDGILAYARMLEKHDIGIKYDIICWNPYETEHSLKEGMAFLAALPKGVRVDVIQLKFFPGCPISEMPTPPATMGFSQYEYWAMVYQMILTSTETADMAFGIVADGRYTDDSDGLGRVFKQAVYNLPDQLRLKAVADLPQGAMLTNVMVEFEKSSMPGILFEDVQQVLGLKLRCDVPKGALLKWEHVYSTYETKAFGEDGSSGLDPAGVA